MREGGARPCWVRPPARPKAVAARWAGVGGRLSLAVILLGVGCTCLLCICLHLHPFHLHLHLLLLLLLLLLLQWLLCVLWTSRQTQGRKRANANEGDQGLLAAVALAPQEWWGAAPCQGGLCWGCLWVRSAAGQGSRGTSGCMARGTWESLALVGGREGQIQSRMRPKQAGGQTPPRSARSPGYVVPAAASGTLDPVATG